MKNLKEITAMIFKTGTWQSALFFAVLGLIVALLLIFIGFWKTLLIVVCCLVGAFIGGVSDKKAFIQRVISGFRREQD